MGTLITKTVAGYLTGGAPVDHRVEHVPYRLCPDRSESCPGSMLHIPSRYLPFLRLYLTL